METAALSDALDVQQVFGLVSQHVNFTVPDQSSGMPSVKDIGILKEGEHRGGSSSFSTLLATLIPLLLISIPLVIAFLCLRQRVDRVYAPRTFLGVLHDEEKTPKPAFGMFNWFSQFRKLPDEFLLIHQSLDSYLFIRFFRVITRICFVGTCITWAVLIYVNGTGGGGESELGRVTISNVTDPSRYYWHALVAWIFVGYVMYTNTRETIYYINLRQAYLMTPRNASRISTRTVLFTSVPEDYRDERWIRGEYKDVERVWFATDIQELESLVSARDNLAYGLEDSEIKLSTIATKKLLRGEKHHADDPERSGSLASQWLTQSNRAALN
ncbi:phosphate metabolism protein 7 [Cryomyces antarcticus]|nr:phosphate metabolism protein 7 [Cryomyces antarcticus]